MGNNYYTGRHNNSGDGQQHCKTVRQLSSTNRHAIRIIKQPPTNYSINAFTPLHHIRFCSVSTKCTLEAWCCSKQWMQNSLLTGEGERRRVSQSWSLGFLSRVPVVLHRFSLGLAWTIRRTDCYRTKSKANS